MAIATCAWVRARLPLLAGGDALGLDNRHVQRHLLRCATCRARLAALEQSQNVLLSAAVLDPVGAHDADVRPLWTDLKAQIQANPRPRVRSAWSLRARSTWPQWAVPGVGLAAAALVSIGLYLLGPSSDTTQMADSGATGLSDPAPSESTPRLLKPTPYEAAELEKNNRRTYPRRSSTAYSRRDDPPLDASRSSAPASRSSRLTQ